MLTPRLSRLADQGFFEIHRTSEEQFDLAARSRYAALVATAVDMIAEDPERILSTGRPDSGTVSGRGICAAAETAPQAARSRALATSSSIESWATKSLLGECWITSWSRRSTSLTTCIGRKSDPSLWNSVTVLRYRVAASCVIPGARQASSLHVPRLPGLPSERW